MLVPVILGSLKKRSRDDRLDATGLANLLKGQQANISGAMPGNLADMLSGVQGLTGMADWAKSSAGAAVRTGQAAAGRAVDQGRGGRAGGIRARSGCCRCWQPIVLAGLLWYFWPKAKPSNHRLGASRVTQGVDAVTDGHQRHHGSVQAGHGRLHGDYRCRVGSDRPAATARPGHAVRRLQ